MNPWVLIGTHDRHYLYGYDMEETDGVLLVTFNAIASVILLGYFGELQTV